MFEKLSLIALLSYAICGCASSSSGRAPARADSYGVPRCAAAASDTLLSVDALQCWFDAPHGHWRTLSTESHFDVLVVRVEAYDLRDAGDIARRFVAGQRDTFSEILTYVQPERRSRSTIRRVRWTRNGGFESFDFSDTR